MSSKKMLKCINKQKINTYIINYKQVNLRRRGMSKKKHREKQTSNMNNNMNMRNPMNNPFGINPQQLLSMFGGNMDMNKLGNILSSMNREGFNLNNINSQMNNGNFNMNNQSKEYNDVSNESANINMEGNNDDNMEFLLSLRRIVDSSRLDFIDKIIELYDKGAFKK